MFWNRLMQCRVLLLLAAICVDQSSGTVDAGEFNPVLKIHDPAPEWKDLPGTDDRKHSLAELKSKDVVVVVFTCNSCPYAEDYEDRIIEFAKTHAGQGGRTALVAINVNKIEDDLLPQMKVRAEKKGFPFVSLFDETQQIAKDFGATTTPEFFVLNKDRKVVYMGAMDDDTDAKKAKRNYVAEAVTATLAGKEPQVKETVPVGCLIRFDRQRRKKSS